jgi:glyoxylate/hydroxypyruvate reductase A
MTSETPGRSLTVLIGSPLEPEHVERIAAVAPDRVRVVYAPELLPISRYEADHHGIRRDLGEAELARWRRYLAEADVMFDFDWFEPENVAVNAPRLRWVQTTSAGIGEYLIRTGLADTGITFTTAAGTHAVPLAEHVALGLLYLTKRVYDLRAWQADHRWERFTTHQLAGTRMLLVGLGNVGRQVARTCAGLGVEVWGIDPGVTVAPEGVTRLVDPDTMRGTLGDVDALVLACPYTPATHHLIGAPEFAAMRPGTFLVNISRGPVIDEPTMVAALRDGRLGGAVLDVFETEPLPDDSLLWDMPNVLVSPHSASTVSAENAVITGIFVDNLRRYLAGEPLRNVFDRARGF